MAIGYACLVLGVPATAMHTCNARNADDQKLRGITLQNLQALEKIMDYNIGNGIRLFRLSSDLVPFGSHFLNKQHWWEDHAALLDRIGEKIRRSGIRISMHPGQYTVLNSPREDVVLRAKEDLIYHDRLMTALGAGKENKIVLHIGGVYGDKASSIERFIKSYDDLPAGIKDRLVLENDEKCYTAADVLEICKTIGIPAVFDVLHHRINPSIPADRNSPNGRSAAEQDATGMDAIIFEWIRLFATTWKEADGPQKIHYAQQAAGGRTGAHSQTIDLSGFIAFYDGLASEAARRPDPVDRRQVSAVHPDMPDIMLEVKDKNISAIKCMYAAEPEKIPPSGLEKEWARYKYLVLSKSASLYHQLSQLMKAPPAASVRTFYDLTAKAQAMPFDVGAAQNAALHVWGYFKDQCTGKEKKAFVLKFDGFVQGSVSEALVKKQLLNLAEKYDSQYLLNTYYFL
jgi:UV DNA damage endonuclease